MKKEWSNTIQDHLLWVNLFWSPGSAWSSKQQLWYSGSDSYHEDKEDEH
jgi:hypothetical protein